MDYDVELTEKVKSVQLEIAEVIKDVCEKNGIRYYLAYGTLLGAVRHDGFIPWDDDIDIMIPYPDLLKFEQACKTDLPKGYFYQSPETDPEFRLSIMRVCKDNTLLIEKGTESKNIHHGIFVDIYPIYGAAPKNRRKLQIFRAMKRALYLLDEPVKNHGAVMRLGSSFLLKTKTKKGKARAEKKLFQKIARYDYDQSDNVVCLDSTIKIMSTEFKREWFGNGVMHKFGDTEFMIPEKPDAVLTKMYGDYMVLPPEEERKPHHDFVRIEFDCGDETAKE
ncbi:MAG: LicD family protein [Clostridiales bacterium]|nr:LicD family protein [Clostridiales bacterium]